MRHVPLVLVAAAAVAACTPPSGPASLDVVRGFRVSPTFNAFREPCAVQYTLAAPAWVSLRVVRRGDGGAVLLVRELSAERLETAGPRTAAWRGVGPNGLFAPQGAYEVQLIARLEGTDRAEQWTLPTTMYRS